MIYLLYGFGISNNSLAKSLEKKGIAFRILDDSISSQERALAEGYQLFSDELWPQISLAVVSPGVSRNATNSVVIKCRQLGIEITNDISMFMETCSGFAIGVTGSFGKSTCVALFKHISDQFYMIRQRNDPSEIFQIAGNFGIPCFDCDPSRPTIFELSAQQLQISKEPKLEIGVMVNLYEQHLDDFETMDNYLAAKSKILTNSRIKIIGDGIELLGAKRISTKKVEGCSYALIASQKDKQNFDRDGKELIGEEDLQVLYENGVPIAEIQTHLAPSSVISAYAISREIGIPTEIALSETTSTWRFIEQKPIEENLYTISKSIQPFAGLEHRCEMLYLKNRVAINDSKSTNIANTAYCLKAFSKLGRVALICGGKYMEQNLQLLDPLVDMISFVGCIGSSSQIYDYFARHQIPAYLGSMEECLKKCWETKLPVVLSPGYASTDQKNHMIDYIKRRRQMVVMMVINNHFLVILVLPLLLPLVLILDIDHHLYHSQLHVLYCFDHSTQQLISRL